MDSGAMNDQSAKTASRRTSWRRFAKSKTGSAAIEFAMVAPVLFLFLFGIIETGVIYFATAMLQNSTDDTARQFRTGQISGTVTSQSITDTVCSEINGLISPSDCQSNLMVDVRAYSSFGGSSYPGVTKSDGTIDTTKLAVQPTSDCQVVLLRTFYPWKIMTPLLTPLLQNTQTGYYIVSAASAFRTEPYRTDSTC